MHGCDVIGRQRENWNLGYTPEIHLTNVACKGSCWGQKLNGEEERSLDLFLQPGPHVLHLCCHATLGRATGGTVLLHTATVVPHCRHITRKQRAGRRSKGRVKWKRRSGGAKECYYEEVCACVLALTWQSADPPQ